MGETIGTFVLVVGIVIGAIYNVKYHRWEIIENKHKFSNRYSSKYKRRMDITYFISFTIFVLMSEFFPYTTPFFKMLNYVLAVLLAIEAIISFCW